MDATATPPVSRLRASLYARDASWVRPLRVDRTPPPAFVLAVIATILIYTVSGNTLDEVGYGYTTNVGGNPFFKFLPSTYVIAAAAAIALSSRQIGLIFLLKRPPLLLAFTILIVSCAVFAATHVGLTGIGVYIDTYLPAASLAIVMASASGRQRAILARIILALCIINILMALMEYVHQEHFIPMEFKGQDGKTFTDAQSQDFRPAALYTHPLTGAMATAFGIFLLLEINLSFMVASISFIILSVGLLAFGGRAALVVTFGILALRVALTLILDVLKRRINVRLVAITIAGLLVLAPAGAFLLTQTSVGSRISEAAYYDDSAKVRVEQWKILDHMTVEQAMYGIPLQDLDQLYWQVGLQGIESPFLLVFLNLGLVGLPLFIGALTAYGLYLNRFYPASRWLLLAGVIILSTSNSIGVKSPDLFMLTACAVSMHRYRRPKANFRSQVQRPPAFAARGISREVNQRETMGVSAPRRGLSQAVIRRPDVT